MRRLFYKLLSVITLAVSYSLAKTVRTEYNNSCYGERYRKTNRAIAG